MGSVGIGGISGAARDALHPPTTSNQILLDLLEDILDYKYLDFLDSRKCNISTHYFKPDFVEDILDCNHQPFALKIFRIYYKYLYFIDSRKCNVSTRPVHKNLFLEFPK